MEAATAPPKQEVVTFRSFSPNQRVTVVPKRRKVDRDVSGTVVGSEPIPGKEAQFVDGNFATDDPEIIEYLRNHDDFKEDASLVSSQRSGWCEDYDMARPSPDERHKDISRLAAEGDADGLRALIADEEGTGAPREAVLAPANEALTVLEEQERMVADVDAKPEGKADENPSPPAEAGSDVKPEGSDGEPR